MTDLNKRFSRLEARGLLKPIKGLPCPLDAKPIDFADCSHSFYEVEEAIKWWKQNKKYSKMFGVSNS